MAIVFNPIMPDAPARFSTTMAWPSSRDAAWHKARIATSAVPPGAQGQMKVIGFSGYAMWFAPFFARFLPGWALNAVLVIHSEEGLLAILFIFSIHFVNTHLRPDSFPMDMVIFTGVETEEEFKHKRPMEYERLARTGKLETRIDEKPATWLVHAARVVGFIAIGFGLLLLVLTLSAYFI